MKRPWYKIKAAANGNAKIYIYDRIGKSWWTDDPAMSASKFIEKLDALEAQHIDLHVNSLGGDVFEGHAIYNAIKAHEAGVTAYVDGIAASIASEVIEAADEVVIAENGMVMIHKPWSWQIGNEDDMMRTAAALKKIGISIAATYVRKTGMSIDEVMAAMAAESWYTAEEALEAGFVDRVGDEVQIEERTTEDFAAYGIRAVPDRFAALLRLPGGAWRADRSDEERDKLISARDAADFARSTIDEVLDTDETDESDDAAAPVAGDSGVKVESRELAALFTGTRYPFEGE